jgi:type I restriction-modification system DNA methylase subunit
MAVVLPHGALFRMGVEGAIREKILQMDILEAVIAHIPHFGGRVGVNRRIPPHLAVEVRWDLKQA